MIKINGVEHYALPNGLGLFVIINDDTRDDRQALLCGLPGVSGQELEGIYEDYLSPLPLGAELTDRQGRELVCIGREEDCAVMWDKSQKEKIIMTKSEIVEMA